MHPIFLSNMVTWFSNEMRIEPSLDVIGSLILYGPDHTLLLKKFGTTDSSWRE